VHKNSKTLNLYSQSAFLPAYDLGGAVIDNARRSRYLPLEFTQFPKLDLSFDPIRSRAFRASNRDGYLVDLIRPEAKDVFRDNLPTSLTDHLDDLEGAAIFGLNWLVNSPRCEAVAIDERGYPVPMAVVDPRVFALHKAWLSSREDRERLKAKRDWEQAKFAAAIAVQYLRLPFGSKDLEALPGSLRKLAPKLSRTIEEVSEHSSKPDW
jgi:Nucleotidyltransferase